MRPTEEREQDSDAKKSVSPLKEKNDDDNCAASNDANGDSNVLSVQETNKNESVPENTDSVNANLGKQKDYLHFAH